MDRPNLNRQVHSPADYIAAWRHIRSIFQQERATDVGWVWCPLASGFANDRAPAYFPGGNQVDWICADAYAFNPAQSLSSVVRPFLDWARSKGKPLMIGEFGTQPSGTGARARWLENVVALARRTPAVKAVVYFDANTRAGGTKLRRWSLRGFPQDLAAFHKLAADPYFNTRHLRITGK
jgi:beta-mannanase